MALKTYFLYLGPSLCQDGDVLLENDNTPYIYFSDKWRPICGHYFWDNNRGATLFCKKLGFTTGEVFGKDDGKQYGNVEAFWIGKCKDSDNYFPSAKDDDHNCNGGCNDFKLGRRCSKFGSFSKCGAHEKVKITIKCHPSDNGKKSVSSCTTRGND